MSANLKRRILGLIAAALILTVLIAAALPRMQLGPGVPLPFSQQETTLREAEASPMVSINFPTFLKAILGFMLVLIAVFLVVKAIKSIPWKLLLVPGAAILTISLIVIFVLFSLLGVRVNPTPAAPDVLPPDLSVTAPPLAPLPAYLIWLVWGLFGLVLLFLGFMVLRSRAHTLRDPFTLPAEQAIQDLLAGSDLQDVVVRCYIQMSRALQKEQGLARDQAMTAREFELVLEQRGFPGAPVRQLTSLFENARYGQQRPAPGEEQVALDCLRAIVEYSHSLPPTKA